MKRKSIIAILLAILFVTSATMVSAEDEDYPIYIVQPGDSLTGIALQFGVDIDELIAINNIIDPSALPIGAELILPGLEGITGVLTTINLEAGENLHSLSIKSEVIPEALMQINKLSSPTELYYNANIIIPLSEEKEADYFNPITVWTSSSTLLEEAVRTNNTEWSIANTNQVENTWSFLPNVVLYEKTASSLQALISPTIANITISPDEIFQGNVVTIKVTTIGDNKPTGTYNERPLSFFQSEENTFTALQGISAMHDVGLDELQIATELDRSETFRFEQHLLTFETFYPSESISVDPITLDAETQKQEDARIAEVVSKITKEKYWNEPFLCVVDQPTCVRSWYGTNRNYNDGLYYSYHSGIDYGVCATLNIYAPADGVVVFTDSLTIRGNATYIDHGHGVFSAFFHQSEIWVEEGDLIKAGDIIGQIGTTGRSTGGHLHYDLVINGEQVDPLLWLPADCR